MSTMSPGFDMVGPFPTPYDAELVAEVDHTVEDRAALVAEEGAQLGRSLGLQAEAHAIADVAVQCEAAAVVIGSHGVWGLRSHLLGSTSRDILARCGRPVVVVVHGS